VGVIKVSFDKMEAQVLISQMRLYWSGMGPWRIWAEMGMRSISSPYSAIRLL
jgi:hypothetical protein